LSALFFLKKRKMSELKGNRINACLNERNMSRSELIDITQIDSSHIAKIINNKQKGISLTTAYKIASALEYPIEVVFIL
jgi:DNA-binding Xre family transcriptional regulator